MNGSISPMKPRRSFEEGHRRKFLIVVDESQEVESALYYAASRVQRSSGLIVMLYVIEQSELQHWAGVRQVQIEEETTKAKALFRLFRRKLAHAGFENVETEDVIREGRTAEELHKLIAWMKMSRSSFWAPRSTPRGRGHLLVRWHRPGSRAVSPCPSRSSPANFRSQKSRLWLKLVIE
jgi:Universal stress protein family